MNYLIISTIGCGFYFVPHLGKSEDTEKVYFYCVDTKMGKLGKDMQNFRGWEKFERIKEPFGVIKDADKSNLIVIFDDNGWGSLADDLRNRGYAVAGGSALADRLENDRWGAIKYMKKIMDVPETEYYKNFDEGLAVLKGKEKNERWVFKPQDADVPKDKTYVSKDIDDLIKTMEGFKKDWLWQEDYVLQKFVEGTPCDFSCYFSGIDWIAGTFGLYWEEKSSMPGGFGASTGGEIACTFFKENEGKLFDILNKMKPLLLKANYHGQIAVNSIISKEDHRPYFIELTPRWGYPGSDMEITLIEENEHEFSELIKQVAFGITDNRKLYAQDKIAVEATVSTPPYPLDEEANKLVTDLPFSWDKKWDRYMFPWYCQYDKETNEVKLTGVSGHALHVTCAANTMPSAVKMLYDEYVPSIKLKDMQIRDDLGEKFKDDIKQLKNWEII